jgi:hypothetical protein
VQYDMFRFFTKHVRAAAIVKSVEIVDSQNCGAFLIYYVVKLLTVS